METGELQKMLREWTGRQNRLLTLAGRRKAGKTIFLEYLREHYGGFRHFRIADGVNAVAEALKIQPSRRVQHALFGVNKLLYPVIGESVMKRRVAVMLDEEMPPLALVEAVRTEEEFEEFVARRHGILIGIVADDRVRFARLIKDTAIEEKRDEASFTFEEFVGDPEKQTGEFHPIEQEIPGIVARSHFVLDNNSDDPQNLHRQIDEVMEQLGIQKKK